MTRLDAALPLATSLAGLAAPHTGPVFLAPIEPVTVPEYALTYDTTEMTVLADSANEYAPEPATETGTEDDGPASWVDAPSTLNETDDREHRQETVEMFRELAQLK